MFVAARLICSDEVLQPRKMVKVSESDSCGSVLNNLLDKTPNKSDYVIHSILAFVDVRELEESQIKLEVEDDMPNVINLGYKFITFRVIKAEATGNVAKKYNSESDHSSSISTADPPEPVTDSKQLATVAPSEDPLYLDCICGRSVLRSTQKSHERYCAAIRAQKKAAKLTLKTAVGADVVAAAADDTKTHTKYKCECGIVFETMAAFNMHCIDCDMAAGAVLHCVCGKVFTSAEAHQGHQATCSKCRKCARIPGYTAFSRKMFMCGCGELCSAKSQFQMHQESCEENSILSSMTCSCGVIIPQHWNLNLHKKTCSMSSKESSSRQKGAAPVAPPSSAHSTQPSNEILQTPVRGRAAQKRSRQELLTPVDTESLFVEDKFELIKLRHAKRLESCSQNKAVKPPKTSNPLSMPCDDAPPKKKVARKKNVDPDTQFEVEMILLHSGSVSDAENINFLIRWKGYDSSEDCWLPYDECRDLKALDDYCIVHPELAPLLSKD